MHKISEVNLSALFMKIHEDFSSIMGTNAVQCQLTQCGQYENSADKLTSEIFLHMVLH